MTRMFGYFANQADRIRCALTAEGEALHLAAAVRPDGWGVGSYQGGEVLLRRRPTDSRETLRLLDLVRELRTDCAIAHVRTATVGPRTIENTHPFRYRQWLFAHNGTLPGFATHRRRLLEGVPEFLARNLRGDTDSEAVFCLFLGFVHETGRLDDPEFDRSAMVAALRQTVDAVDGTLGGGAKLNLVVTNGHAMVALRRGLAMAWVRRHGIRDCGTCRRQPESAGREPKRVDHEAFRYVLVASEPHAPGHGWQEVPDSPGGTFVAIDRQLNVQVSGA